MITRKARKLLRGGMVTMVSLTLALVLVGCGDDQDKGASGRKKPDPHADHDEHDGHDHSKHK